MTPTPDLLSTTTPLPLSTGRPARPVVAAWLAICTALVLVSPSCAGGDSRDGTELPDVVTFNAHIRPIMSNTCFACHGPDEEDNPTEFRIDSFELATEPLPSDDELVGIKPGDSAASEVYLRIIGEGDGEQMPPAEFRHQLSDYEKALFGKWIDQGAEYQQHWSYAPVERPAVPPVEDATDRVANEIDSFILARLEREGVTPSPVAAKATLLRRLSLDLIGLPPTLAELEGFLGDESPDAYAKQVDRLLASRHFGERMAPQWLDAVRFADTVGFHGDQNQRIYPYRDYVINALNDNVPFDQFTREQLAGDLLPNPTTRQLTATGVVRMNMMTREGGAQPEEYLAKYAADRVRVLGTAWMGATTGCCECHNHKFDPFTIKDFYSLASFFDDVRQWGIYSNFASLNPELKGFDNNHPFPPEMRFKAESAIDQIEELEQQLDLAIAPRVSASERQSDAFAAWVQKARAVIENNSDGWVKAPIADATADAESEHRVLEDGSLLVTGDPADRQYSLTLDVDSGMPIVAFRVEALPDEANGGFVGRGDGGRFEISTPIAVERVRQDDSPEPPAPISARYVRVEVDDQWLSLAEVEVFGANESDEPENLALSGTASQSTDYNGLGASRAIDGNTDGSESAASYTHTERTEKSWWEVDLKQTRLIDRIAVWNRQGFAERLRGYRVVLLSESREVVWRDKPPMPRPNTEIEPTGSGSGAAQRKVEIAWVQADRWTPSRYRSGLAPPYLSNTWKSGPELWQLPKDEARLPHTAVFRLEKPITLEPGERLRFRLGSTDLGRVRVSVTPFARSAAGMPSVNDRLRAALSDPEATDHPAVAAAYVLATQPTDSQDTTIRGYREAIAGLNSGYVMTLVADPVEEERRRVSRVLPRGDWQDQSGPVVQPDTPDFLPKLPGAGEGRLTRLDLAEWLTSRENPLTARHYVNRTWKHFFGTGLSARLDDLGNQGEWPSHPLLLDWLAVDFMESGWDVKGLIRQLVMSNTYRQAASVRGDLVDADPYNRLLAQQAARRLEAEAVRDNALAISGLLQLSRVGGPSVKPYQPNGYWGVMQYPTRSYTTSQRREQYRRGLYVHWQRTFLHPMLANFDAPPRDECTADRPQSNSPQQALTLLNDPSFVEASVAMADRLLGETADEGVRERLDTAFKMALSRPATDEEATALEALLDRQLTHFASAKDDRDKLLTTGYFRPDSRLDPVEVAAWSQVCRVVLNLHEVITRY